MLNEETQELFTDKFIDNIRRAVERNQQEAKDTNVYHHPTQAGVVEKCIDLSCHKPLTKMHTAENKPKSQSAERWLEAYLIRKAKTNDWVLELAGKQCRFLTSQLKFKKEGETQGRTHRLLDILLYDQQDNELVILELKGVRQLKGAKRELDYYKRKVTESADGLRQAYKLGSIRNISGYVVWPATSKEGKLVQDLDKYLGGYGLIEYDSPHGIVRDGELVKPWERFREIDDDLTIAFVCKKQPR